MVKIIFMTVIFWLLAKSVSSFTIASEKDLRQDLFTNKSYDVNVRPENLVTINVLLNILTINTMDIRAQTFKASGWLTLVWYDQRLAWNKTGFGSIGFIFATQTEVWRPALIVSNSVAVLGVIEDDYTPFRITNEGNVIWEPPMIFEVQCEADITYYPFDEQECNIVLQSWGYNLREVNVTTIYDGINLNEFRRNGEWDLIENRAERGDSTDAKGDEYGQLKFYFRLRRRSQYYWLNVLLPVIVNSVLTALVFALPAESGEKMGYSLTVLLSFAVLLTLVADKIPSTSITTSYIVVYFAIVLIMAALAVVLSTVVLDIYFNNDSDPIPKWMKSMFRTFGRILCYDGCKKRPNKVKDLSSELGKKPINQPTKASTIKAQLLASTDTPGVTKQPSWMEYPEDELDWKDISRILDVFFLRFYLCTIVLVTVGFLTAAATHF